jgi:putative tricarboxylic transport membrane protein
MRRYGYPVAPMVVGLILGPIFENQLRRSLAISQGDPVALISSPIAATIYVVLILIFALSFWMRKRQNALESEIVEESPEAAGTDSGPGPGDGAGPEPSGAPAGTTSTPRESKETTP